MTYHIGDEESGISRPPTLSGNESLPPHHLHNRRAESFPRDGSPPPQRLPSHQDPSIRLQSPRPPTIDAPNVPESDNQNTSGSLVSSSSSPEDIPSLPFFPGFYHEERTEKWIWEHYGKYLVRKVAPWAFSEHQGQEGYEVSIAETQRMYMLSLRTELAMYIANLCRIRGHYHGPWKQGWGNLVHSYVQALQDYEYMDKFSKRSPGSDPFHLTAESKLDRIILARAFRGIPRDHLPNLNRDPRYVKEWQSTIGPIVPSRSDNYYSKLSSRIVVSLIGAAFLIGPMWLMMLDTRLYVALGSTTGFVVAFGVLMAIRLDEHNHVLSSTAAYAAVLVVFVGLRGQGGSVTVS